MSVCEDQEVLSRLDPETIFEELKVAARGTPYPPKAFALVQEAFWAAEERAYEFSTKFLFQLCINLPSPIFADEQEAHRVLASDVCWQVPVLAFDRWGLMAPTVLAQWNINDSSNIGRIIEILAAAGLLCKDTLQAGKAERLEGCRWLFDFDDVFDSDDYVEIDLDHQHKPVL